MTAADIKRAEARYRRATARYAEALDARNAVVRAALDAGMTHATIAEATGLTRGRINQLARTVKVIAPSPASPLTVGPAAVAVSREVKRHPKASSRSTVST